MTRRKAKPLPRKSPDLVLSRKLTMRLSEDNCDQLTELRIALHARSDADAVRAIIRTQHAALTKAAKRAARAARREVEAREAQARQLSLGGVK